LTPPDFFLWGYLKSKVCNCSQSLAALKVNIQEEIANISAETLCHIMKSAKLSLNFNAKDSHLPDIIFRTGKVVLMPINDIHQDLERILTFL